MNPCDPFGWHSLLAQEALITVFLYIYISIYRESVSRFSRGTVLNTLMHCGINILRGKKDATTFPDKPVS